MSEAFDAGVREGMEKTAVSLKKGIGAMVERTRRSMRKIKDFEEKAKLFRPGTSGERNFMRKARREQEKLKDKAESFQRWTRARADMEKTPKGSKPSRGLLKAMGAGAVVGTPVVVYATRKQKKKS